jgi:hypothetical protein
VSVYLALHTTPSPTIGEIAEFGRRALDLGCDPSQPLVVQREANGALTVLIISAVVAVQESP